MRARAIRVCTKQDAPEILAIINAAADSYRGVIPWDCWHEPYFPETQLESELAEGIRFSGYIAEGRLVGVMGLQSVRDVDLIRHAYVLPAYQSHGIGALLLSHLRTTTSRPVLIGTWAAAVRAIAFYERNNFEVLPHATAQTLLERYWSVPARQREVSVVLAERGRTWEATV